MIRPSLDSKKKYTSSLLLVGHCTFCSGIMVSLLDTTSNWKPETSTPAGISMLITTGALSCF
eukprot:scaffold5310_cov378-Prasinococcus_capsulatus_cf.AAC.16